MPRARIRAIVRQFSQNGMKLLLQDPRNVRDLLAAWNIDLLHLIEFDRAKLVPTTFVQRDYRHVEADVVLRAPLLSPRKHTSPQQITIYILIEHQSEPDSTMSFRLLEYVVQIYKAQAREWDQHHRSFSGMKLHPVLPVVFYTGTRKWDRLSSLVDLVEMGDRFATIIPKLDSLFLNLSALPATKLEANGGFFGWVLRLVQQRHARPSEFQNVLRRAVEHLEAMPAAERLRWLELLSYLQALVYHERNEAEHTGLQEEIETSVDSDTHRKEVAIMGRTIAESLIDKGKKEGRKAEALRSRRQILVDQLSERFGELPPSTVAAIESAKTIEQLDVWLRRFAKVSSLEKMGIV